ncbi:hypothetical protein [Actinoplanes sp. NPDC026623]|uniref:hypothetical protein n=1 Tax=Actinoplanes sp. NPDC026623 TaxID=3155610 RepID=UPI0034029702
MRREQKTIERSPGFRGTPVQTAVDATPAPRAAAVETCAEHRMAKTYCGCGVYRSDRFLAPWDLKPAPTKGVRLGTEPDGERWDR